MLFSLVKNKTKKIQIFFSCLYKMYKEIFVSKDALSLLCEQ